MSAYGPVWSSAKAQKLLIFGVSGNAHLTLRQFDASGEGKPTAATDTTDLAPGIISIPSNIVAVEFNEWTRVYGIIKKKNSQGTEQKVIYMLSPVHETVAPGDIVTPAGSLAGVSNGKSDAYLYYLDGTNKINSLKLQGESDPQPIETLPLKPQTSIAACIGADGHRYIAYQLPKRTIQVYDVVAKNPLPEIKGTSTSATALTPLALVNYKKAGNIYMSVYYVNTEDTSYIQRSQRIDNGDWVDKVLDQAGLPSQSTTLSATWDAKAEQVIVSFKLTKGDLVCVQDEW
ncbi:hypothetical protein BDV95DRAFT_612807 [Massariosphaeria phaeospora]|uniref:Fucose-specific lectin n=1 Tax=Massariosphaeria phaeospora TaxID=100035 RepID=A0A7C8I4Y0_9PLEO|nr:hypothetical protein BDV95DRAFT_612807 [Massariosphaeria phaeospora]